MIEFYDDRPPASAEALAAAERVLAEERQMIPPSYRAFLAERDGGEPRQSTFEFRERDVRDQRDLVQWFYSVEPSPGGSLADTVMSLHGRLIPGMLPIACDPLGNQLLLDTRDGADGPIWWWDHERETTPPDESNLSWVADDFPSFLAMLHADEDEDDQPSVEPSRPGPLKRLFGRG